MFHLPASSLARPVVTSAVLAAVAASCGGANGAAADSEYAGTVDALCQARDADDPGTADVAFFAGAHDGLHRLAAAVTEVDRGVAADLLISKNRVETALREERPVDEVRPAVVDLLTEVGVSLETIDQPVPTC